MASPLPGTKTEPLYQKDGHLYTHTSSSLTIAPLASLPPDTQSLFKPPPDGVPYVLTPSSTIFHAQGGGQPSDTGTIIADGRAFDVLQVRAVPPGILHMGTFAATATATGSATETAAGSAAPADSASGHQAIDVPKRLLHSRLHTAGHILGLAASLLKKRGALDPSIVDGKASHYPGASFVEFAGLIPGDAKPALQAAADELVAADLAVGIHYWSEERARRECTGVLESFKQDEDGVRVVEIGDVGSYPCGGTHVRRTGECGRVVVRNIKRQKGVTKVSYEVQDV